MLLHGSLSKRRGSTRVLLCLRRVSGPAVRPQKQQVDLRCATGTTKLQGPSKSAHDKDACGGALPTHAWQGWHHVPQAVRRLLLLSLLSSLNEAFKNAMEQAELL